MFNHFSCPENYLSGIGCNIISLYAKVIKSIIKKKQYHRFSINHYTFKFRKNIFQQENGILITQE